MAASLEFKYFVQEILIPLQSIEHSTPPTTKLRTGQMVPLCMVRPAECFTIPIMSGPPPKALIGNSFPVFLFFAKCTASLILRWLFVKRKCYLQNKTECNTFWQSGWAGAFTTTTKLFMNQKLSIEIKIFCRKLETSKETQSSQRPSHHVQDSFPLKIICIVGVSNREP